MAIILDGKETARKIRENLKEKVKHHQKLILVEISKSILLVGGEDYGNR